MKCVVRRARGRLAVVGDRPIHAALYRLTSNAVNSPLAGRIEVRVCVTYPSISACTAPTN